MNTININGVSYQSKGNITVINGKVIIDGDDVTPNGKEINISIDGNIENLDIDVCSKLSITGDVNRLKTTSGDVEVSGNIKGSVNTMSGDVECRGDVDGDITTMSGDVDCGKVAGSIKSTSGNIKQRII